MSSNVESHACLVHLGAQAEGLQYHPPNAPWPNPDIMRTMPFDYTIHDPKYDDISAVYCPGYRPSAEGKNSECLSLNITLNLCNSPDLCFPLFHKETLCVRRMCTYAGGHPGSSCLNMQLITPITTVNSVISTWASTQGTRSV